MRQTIKILVGLFLACVTAPFSAFAGDGATLMFREGQIAYINNGYSTLIEEYKKMNNGDRDNYIIELKLESNPFYINLADVVIICRDRCTSLEVIDPRKSPTNNR